MSICLNPGEQENIEKFTKRLVKVTKQHNDECKKLLTLMGVPYIEVSCNSACKLAKQFELFSSLTQIFGRFLKP